MRNKLKEQQSRTIEFVLLCVVWVVCIFLAVNHFSSSLAVDSSAVLEDLAEKREIIRKQKKVVKKMEQIYGEIGTTNFDLRQSHKFNDISYDIKQLDLTFTRNDGDPKFVFSKQAANILAYLFDMRTIISTQKGNLKNVKDNIAECQAGIDMIK